MKKLKVGDRVIAKFLGTINYCTVIEVTSPGSYKLKSTTGTVLPNSVWKKKAPVDKKGKIISPWYIEELYKNK
jgi:hypothetical protein